MAPGMPDGDSAYPWAKVTFMQFENAVRK